MRQRDQSHGKHNDGGMDSDSRIPWFGESMIRWFVWFGESRIRIIKFGYGYTESRIRILKQRHTESESRIRILNWSQPNPNHESESYIINKPNPNHESESWITNQPNPNHESESWIATESRIIKKSMIRDSVRNFIVFWKQIMWLEYNFCPSLWCLQFLRHFFL